MDITNTNGAAHPTTIAYQLPDQRIVNVPFDVCKGASVLLYTLKTGRLVTAVICAGQR